MSSDLILANIISVFIASAQRDSFNGIVAASLQRFTDDPALLRCLLADLVRAGKVTCVFASRDANMHIKRFPDMLIEEQLSFLTSEHLEQFCLYPSDSEIADNCDISQWNDRPFSKALALAKPQLTFRAFDMGVLERYTRDPRYTVHFADYMGRMSIGDEYFSNERFPERDKVALQTFGLGFAADHVPHVVVYLRYLAGLSPDHQKYWSSYLVDDEVHPCRQYLQSSILGEVWKNRSVRYAIVEDMRLINEMSEASEPHRVCRRPFRLSYAAMAGSSSMA
jgi:hypothetical protein